MATNSVIAPEHIFSIHCWFCHKIHESQYWDEIDEAILACRDQYLKDNGPEEWKEGPMMTCEARAAIGHA